MFDKIAKSIKGFIKSDVGKVAIGIGSTFLLPGIGATGATTSLGMQGVNLLKGGYAAAKALIPEKGLLGIKGRMAESGLETGVSSLMAMTGGSGGSSYGGGSTGYRTTAAEGLTTYSPEGAARVQGPAAADYSAFLNESIAMYNYAETQGRKIT